jgi:hypothetical protein
MLTVYGQHHPRADVDRLHFLRKGGGRGLMKLERTYTAEVRKWMEYVESKEHPLIQIVKTHQHHTDSTLLQTARIF